MNEGKEPFRWISLCDTYLYHDQEKLTPQMELLYGRAMEEIEFCARQGRQALYEAVSRHGAALAWLGLGDLEVGDPCWPTIPPTRQVRALLAYYLQRGDLRAYDLDSGREVSFGRDLTSSGSGPVNHRGPSFGVVNGRMTVKPLDPASDSHDLGADVFCPERHLWLAETPLAAPLRLHMPLWNTAFARSDSVARFLPEESGQTVRMEAVGLIRWEGDTVYCEPVAVMVLR